MTRISVFLPQPQYTALQALAKWHDRPAAELLRDALRRYLRDEPPPPTKGRRKQQQRRAIRLRK